MTLRSTMLRSAAFSFSARVFACALLAAMALAVPGVAESAVSHPQEIINRPRTLPWGQLELRGGVDLSRSTYWDGMVNRTQTSLFAPLALGYGITNDFDIYLFYGLGLHPDLTGRTPVEVRLAYTFFRGERMTAAAQVRSGIDLGSEEVTPLRIGVNALYRVTPIFAIFTPGEQLRIGLAGTGDRPIGLDLPVGVGLQFTPQVFGSVTTNLAHIGIANDGDAFIFADMLRTDLAAFYSFSNRFDIGAHLDIDLKNTDFLTVGVFARAFL